MSKNLSYFKKREQEAQEKLNKMIYRKSEYTAMILEEQKQMALDMIDKLFEDYSQDYVLDRKMLERQASKFDVQQFTQRAKKIVESKDMSYSANYKMRMYDVTQKVSRLELLLNELNLELLSTNEKTSASMGDVLDEVKKEELKRQANIFDMSDKHIQNVTKALSNSWLKGTTFSSAWGNDLNNLYNILDTSIKRAVTYGKHPYEMKNIINKEFKTIDAWSKRILITEATHIQSKVQYESFKQSGYKYFRFIAEPSACSHCKPFDDRVFPMSDFEKMMAVPPIHPYCRCSLVPATEEEYQEQLAKDEEKNKGKTNSSFISDDTKNRMENAWGKDYTDKFLESLDNLPKNDIRTRLLRDELDNVEFGKISNQRAHANGSIVNLNKQAFDGSKGKLPLEIVYHEIGHAIDSILMKKFSGKSAVPTGNLVKVGKYKVNEMAREISSYPDFEGVLSDSINKDVWRMVNGDLTMFESLGKKPRKKLEKEIWENQRTEIFKKYSENSDKFIKEWISKPKEHTVGLSDIMESTPYFDDYPLGSGHGKKYYKSYGKKETEFMAHYFEGLVNKDKQVVLDDYFKQSLNELKRILKEAM